MSPPILLIVPVVCVCLVLATVAYVVSQRVKSARLEREEVERRARVDALAACVPPAVQRRDIA